MADEFTPFYQIVFFSTFALLILLERVGSLQREWVPINGRWTTNIGLLIIAAVVGSFAALVATHSIARAPVPGFLSHHYMPLGAEIALTVLLVDLWRYWEHRFFHWTPMLWRVHLVHHSDTQLDVTTAERHHPLEVLLSTAVMTALILAFGLSTAGMGLYLLVATVVAFSSHANLRLPESFDRILRCLIVTPRVHAVHHSDLKAETNGNYGAVFTVWDRLFGSYVDPKNAKIPHFGLEYFHKESDTGLRRVLQQPFLYRAGMVYPNRESGPHVVPSRPAALSQSWRSASLGGLAGCVLTALVLWHTALDVVTIWTNNEAYQYAWLVVPVVVYLLAWERRKETLAFDPQPGYWGVCLAASAAVIWVVAALLNIDVGRHFALVLIVHAVALSTLGWYSYRRLFPIFALLFFAIPASDLLQPLLRTATVKSIELFAGIAQLPHAINGFAVVIGSHRYIVVEACSGLSYVTLAAFLSYTFGLLLYRSLWKTVGLTVLGAFLGVLTNAVRVNSIILIDWIQGSQMELSTHGGIQWMALLLTLGLLFVLLSRLEPDWHALKPLTASPPKLKHQLAPVFAGLVVVLIVGSSLALAATAPETSRVGRPLAVPQHIRGWELTSVGAKWVADAHHDRESLNLVYQRDGQDIHILIVQTLSSNAKLTTPRIGGDDSKPWHEAKTNTKMVCVDSVCQPLLHTVWLGKGQDQRHVFYNFGIGRFATDSQLSLRAAHGWHRLTGSGRKPSLIALTFPDAAPELNEVAAALSVFQSLLEQRQL